MNLNEGNQRPEIKYPCQWSFKVIGKDVDNLLSAIEEASYGIDYEVSPSNVSENEKYFSLNFTLQVPNEVTRDIIYKKLADHKDVKIVL